MDPCALWQPSQRPPCGEFDGQVVAVEAACVWHCGQRCSAARAGWCGWWHAWQRACAEPARSAPLA